MLNFFEMIEQRRLKKSDADIYDVVLTITLPDGKKKNITYSVYAETENDAYELGNKLRFREQEKIDEGATTIDRLGLNILEMKDNKLGLIFPWKDPVYKRSFSRGSRLPMLRAKAQSKAIVQLLLGDHKKILKDQMDDSKINKLIVGCIKSYFICGSLLLIIAYSAFTNISAGRHSLYIVCALLASSLYTLICLYFTVRKHKTLLSWKLGATNGE
ncbi:MULTISPECIES: hypothetical protein [Pseudoalteromonas]|uniref:hypothetical protein n=1 Tax=Pseudoalteromonas TaxID=53246 RepID=UPI00158408D9|nr:MULTISPECIES: hypothetical protein [Pseudoalteromonas]MDI4652587.1 hypothetical protein [Pseudoalteromonas shioyasakiensis]NUJ38705.1 hypothetical protein [Pseudoalteromonas sp. 0303]